MTDMTDRRSWAIAGAVSILLICACAVRQRPKELVAFEGLWSDPALSLSDRHASDLLAAAGELFVSAEAEWDHHDAYRARRDALMGQIKMKTALAILQAIRSQERIARLDRELVAARTEVEALGEQLATADEEVALLERLRAIKLAADRDRKDLAQQVDAFKKQAASERQRFTETLEMKERRTEALDGIRKAELALRTSETVDAPRYAKAKYSAAAGMLQDAHKEFDAAHWDGVLARTTLARAAAEQGLELARPQYEKAAEMASNRARDRALEADATSLPGIQTRLERDHDLQRLVLIVHGLFSDKKSILVPTSTSILDAIKDLLAKYPAYSVQVGEICSEQGKPAELATLSLARANAVYWALVTRGIDPKRMNLDGPIGSDGTSERSPPERGDNKSRVEFSILYHIFE